MPAKKTSLAQQPTPIPTKPSQIVSVSLDLTEVPGRHELAQPQDSESARSYDLTRETLASFVRQLKPGTISKADLEASTLLLIAESAEDRSLNVSLQGVRLLSEIVAPKNDGLSSLGSALARAVDRMGKRKPGANRDDD